MAIEQTQCPYCRNSINVQSEWQGMTLQCPTCGQTFTYNAAPVTPVTPASQFAPVTPASQFAPVTPDAPIMPQFIPADGSAPFVPGIIPDTPNMFTALTKFADFKGRANRREYWLFQLLLGLLTSILFCGTFIGSLVIPSETALSIGWIIFAIGYLIFFIPMLSALVRRLHDTGHSWAYVFMSLIPVIGNWILFFTLCGSSAPDNEWGPNPNAGQRDSAWPCVFAILMNMFVLPLICFGVMIGCVVANVSDSFSNSGMFGDIFKMFDFTARGDSASCINNLKQIGNGIMMYSNDFDDYYPPSRGADGLDLVKEYCGGSDSCFTCPRSKKSTGYYYVGAGLKYTEIENPSRIPIVICADHDDILQVLFADGHVEILTTHGKLDSCTEMVEYIFDEYNVNRNSKEAKIILKNTKHLD